MLRSFEPAVGVNPLWEWRRRGAFGIQGVNSPAPSNYPHGLQVGSKTLYTKANSHRPALEQDMAATRLGWITSSMVRASFTTLVAFWAIWLDWRRGSSSFATFDTASYIAACYFIPSVLLETLAVDIGWMIWIALGASYFADIALLGLAFPDLTAMEAVRLQAPARMSWSVWQLSFASQIQVSTEQSREPVAEAAGSTFANEPPPAPVESPRDSDGIHHGRGR